jgi:antirestriction protein ArdC
MGEDREPLDVHEHITSRIIAAMEAGAGDWQMPWHRSGHAVTRPRNIASGKAYRGINVLSLWLAAEEKGYGDGLWGTYRQWQAAGGQVRRGEKSTVIVFYKELERAREDEAETPETILFARASRVFNIAQVDGVDVPPGEQAPHEDRIEPLEAAEAFAAGTRARIQVGGDCAAYVPGTDTILMPDRERFTGTETLTPTEAWYGVLFHELTHWSGARQRLARDLSGRFGSEAYAMEELVAELGAAFLSADLGIALEPRADHAAYLAHWLKVLKADKRAIFTAAGHASRAADYLASLSGTMQQRAA